MLAEIGKDVDERMSYLARRTEDVSVPTIRPERTAPREEIVHVAGHADGDATKAARKRPPVARFDEEVEVVVLHGKMDETKVRRVAPGGAGQCEPHRRKQMLATEGGKTGAQRGVNGLALAMARAGPVRDSAALRALAPGTAACPSPVGREGKRELLRGTPLSCPYRTSSCSRRGPHVE